MLGKDPFLGYLILGKNCFVHWFILGRDRFLWYLILGKNLFLQYFILDRDRFLGCFILCNDPGLPYIRQGYVCSVLYIRRRLLPGVPYSR
jgi:lipid-A-disaccharide synthase-like uncharacterized protein